MLKRLVNAVVLVVLLVSIAESLAHRGACCGNCGEPLTLRSATGYEAATATDYHCEDCGIEWRCIKWNDGSEEWRRHGAR